MNLKETKKENLIIVDGYNIMFRAYYAMPELINRSGVHVGGIRGFVQMILNLLLSPSSNMLNQRIYQANSSETRIFIALDDGRSNTFRHQMYEAYKANRPEIPETLRSQLKIMREAIDSIGIRYISEEYVEADDIIASYAKAAEKDYNVLIVTTDKDLMQLINPNIKIYNISKKEIIGIEGVKKALNVFPEQIVDYLSLIGDTADNIPGVSGIGPKNGTFLIEKYNSLDAVYGNIDFIKPERIKNLLLKNKDNAYLSKKLITLNSQLEIKVNLSELKWEGIQKNYGKMLNFLTKYSISSELINKYYR